MKRENILLIFLLLLIITGTAAGIGGNLAGNTLINFLKPEMEGLIKAELPEIKIITNIFSIAFFTVILCILSAASTLFRMIEIEPKMVLSRDFSGEKKKKILLRETLALFFLLTGLFLGVLFLTANPKVALVSVFSLSVIFLVFLLLIKGLINLLYKKKFSLPFVGRSIINFIKNQGIIGETAIASLALSLSCIFTISLVQHNIETNLQGRLRNDIPNLYVLDVQEKQIKYLQALFKNTLNLYPNIQGRFISIDQKKIENLPELKRPFNLTYRSELIEGEKLLAGEWHGEKQKKSVSLEKKFAERAGIGIGSEVEFSVQGIPIRATVTSFRTVEESNGLPFFFLVFSPDVLKDAPKSYFGYAYVPEEEIPTRQNQLAMLFPNIAAIPTEQIADTVREITGIVLNSVFAVAFPALFLGILLIFSLMANSARERFKDLLLFKTFGARRKMIFWLYLCESTIFIFISSVFAILVSVISSYLINERFFKFPDFVFNYDLILLIIIILLFSLTFSLYLLRKMFLRPPAVLFRSSL